MIAIETYDANDVQHIITDWIKPKWSTHYGEAGGGFGYLKFDLKRPVGHNYPDIGYGYDVKVRLFLNTIVFHGQIRQIQEKHPNDMTISCVGYVVVAEDDEYLRAFCDTRLTKWTLDSELPDGLWYHPEKFVTGTNPNGIYMGCKNTTYNINDLTILRYQFHPGEIAERIRCNISILPGTGLLFTGTIFSADEGSATVVYNLDAGGETLVEAGMTMINADVEGSAVVASIDTVTNVIIMETNASISGWEAGHNIYVPGPSFRGTVSAIELETLIYDNDIGEGNLLVGYPLVNLTKKEVAEIATIDTGTNTVTVTDDEHIKYWDVGDAIYMYGASLWWARMDGVPNIDVAEGVITFHTGHIGTFLVQETTGWVLWNETAGLGAMATVSSWDVDNLQLNVTDYDDVSKWADLDVIRIVTPFRLSLWHQEKGTSNIFQLWPWDGYSQDWRWGAIPLYRLAIDIENSVETANRFYWQYECYLPGDAFETSFVQIDDIRVYSTPDESTVTTLAKSAVAELSAAGHDIDPSEDDIEEVLHQLEPMIFEFKTVREAMRWACEMRDETFGRLAWGIRPDDRKVLYLERQDLTDVSYTVRADAVYKSKFSTGGDVGKSFQRVTPVYVDKLGNQQIYDVIFDEGEYFSDHYRARYLSLTNVNTPYDANILAQYYLDEAKYPVKASSIEVGEGSVFDANGIGIPIEMMKATGGLVKIEDWRSVEAGRSASDIRNNWTTERIVAIEIDYDGRKAKIIPGGPNDDFETYLARLALIQAQ